MISRRNIRVKVMQAIYTVKTLDKEMKPEEPARLLQKQFDQSKELFVYLIYFLTEVARYAETDAHIRSSKHLPTAEDLNVNTRIAGNEVLWRIREDPGYQAAAGRFKPESRTDRDLVRKMFMKLKSTENYQHYGVLTSRGEKAEREILEFLFNEILLPDEIFINHIEELFINWDDDAEMVITLVRNLVHKPGSLNFSEVMSPDKKEFAFSLLRTTLEKEGHLQSLIVPKLKNWDAERIAALDMIIMRMGVAEFLYFETIPPKVTINEYIDIAKDYSTQQSGQFVNGILDNIHKDLVRENRLHKVDFRKA